MVETEFIYTGVKTVIQCKEDDKMKDICQKFQEKAKIDNNINIFYSYNDQVGFNEELTFGEVANSEDKRRNKMIILVNDLINDNNQNEIRNKDIMKSKNIICPKCKENIKMDIKDYKINLYECKNGHKKENILLNEFEETQNIDLNKIICDICKNNNKGI